MFHPDHFVVDRGLVSKPAIAARSSGASLLAWPQRDADVWRIRAQRIGADGVPIATPLWVSAYGGSSSAVAVDLSPLGDGIIAWKQQIRGIWQIRMRRWWASGSLGPIRIISSPTVTATYVDVSIAPDRTVIAVWQQQPRGGEDGFARAVRWRATGDPEIALRLADDVTLIGRPVPRPVVDMNGRGDAVIVWGRQRHGDCGCWQMWGMQWRTGEEPHAPRLLFDGDATVSMGVEFAAVGVVGDGGAVVVFTSFGSDDHDEWEAHAQRWTASGSLTTENLLDPETAPRVGQPGVAVNSSGDAVVTWTQSLSDFGFDLTILEGRTWLAAEAIGATTRINTEGPGDPVSVDASQVSMRNGKVMMAWVRRDTAGGVDSDSVEARPWSLASGDAPGPITTLFSTSTGAVAWLVLSSSVSTSTFAWTTHDVPETHDRLHAVTES